VKQTPKDESRDGSGSQVPLPPADEPPPPPPSDAAAPPLPNPPDEPPPPPPFDGNRSQAPPPPLDGPAPPLPPTTEPVRVEVVPQLSQFDAPPPEPRQEDRPRRRSGWDERPDGTLAASTAILSDGLQLPLPPAPPPPPAAGAAAAQQQGMALHTIDIEQKYVGYVVGKGGENIRYMEQTTGATVKLDHQNQQTSGCSVCRVYGAPQAAQAAFDLVRVRLASIKGGVDVPQGYISTELELDHKLVRHILGKSGETVRQLQQQSGANITLDSDRSEKVAKEGYPIDLLRLVGKPEAVELAKQLIQQRVDESLTSTFGPEVAMTGDQVVKEMTVEPRYVGVILGKGKETIKLLAEQFKVSIVVKQGLSEQELTSVRIVGDAADAAHSAIMRRIDENRSQLSGMPAGQPCMQGRMGGMNGCNNSNHRWMQGDWICSECGDIQFARNMHCRRCGSPRPNQEWAEGPGCHGCGPMQAMQQQPMMPPARGKGFLMRETDDAFPIQQRFVGMLMGPGGAKLKQIKDATGAKVFIDQETRHQGYSMVRIGDVGSPQHQHALELIHAKLEECGAFNNMDQGFGPSGGFGTNAKGCAGKGGGWNDPSMNMGFGGGGCEYQSGGQFGDGCQGCCTGGKGNMGCYGEGGYLMDPQGCGGGCAMGDGYPGGCMGGQGKGGFNDTGFVNQQCCAGGGPMGDAFAGCGMGGKGGYCEGGFVDQQCCSGGGPMGDGYAGCCMGGQGNVKGGCGAVGFIDQQGCGGGGVWFPDVAGQHGCPPTQTDSWMCPQEW